MIYDYTSSEDDFWAEFDLGSTPMARKVEILFNLGHRELWKSDSKEPLKYWIPALDIAGEHNLQRESIELSEAITRELITNQKDYLRAIDMADHGLALIQDFTIDVEELTSKAHLTWGKAVAYDNLERHSESLAYYASGSAMYADVGNHLLANILTSATIFVHIELDEHDEAEKLIPETRAYFQGKEDLARIAYCDLMTAIIMMHRGQYSEALELALEVMSIEKQVNKLDAGTLRWVAKAYLYNKEYKTALRFYKESIKYASKKGERDYRDVVKATLGLADVYEAMGKTEKAEAARFDAEAIRKRLKKIQVPDNTKVLKEIEQLRSQGEYELAVQLATEVVQESSEAGDISLRIKAECEHIITLFEKEDYEAVVQTWERFPQAVLELYDELVIRIKNMVCHAQYKLGRIAEAAKLNEQVLTDIRLSQNKQEQAYAFENRVEIESDPNEKKKHLSYAIETNLEAQNPDRALKITRKFRDKY
jgi:tetratricopeptide (TPR) repeat protein